MPSSNTESVPQGPLYYRHALPVRITHWINVVAFFILFMSGLQIFNAHPSLEWGKSSYTGKPSLLQMRAEPTGDGAAVGVTVVLGRKFDTTGVLGLSKSAEGTPVSRGFPEWATIPGPRWLSMARRWHLFFAWVFVVNGLAYLAWSIGSRHYSRDLKPTPTDWRSIGRSILDHLRFRHPKGAEATRYNVLQKLAYLIVIFGLLPLVILMGWAMSPWLNSVIPGWIDIVGGRQSARTIHFLAAWALVAFVLIHVFEVIVTGLWNNVRAMITGRYRIPEDRRETE
jgi:thiosulfate reductase cytochrome b subunit